MKAEARSFEPHPHPVDGRRDPAGNSSEALECDAIECVSMRSGDHPHLPRAAQGWTMRARPGPRQRLTDLQVTDNQAISLRERPAEATAERAALAERPAPKDKRDIDAPAYGDVRTQARGDRSDCQDGIASDGTGLPVDRAGRFTSRYRDDAVRIESQCWTSGRAFEKRGALMIPGKSVRSRGGKPISGATRGNPEALKPRPTAVLDRGPAPAVDHLDHVTGTNRSRSPALKRAGGSAAVSNSRRVVRPMRFPPPGLSTA